MRVFRRKYRHRKYGHFSVLKVCIAKCEETTRSVHLHRHERFPNYFVFSKIAFSAKGGPFRHVFHIDSAKHRAFFPDKVKCWLQYSTI